MTGSWKGAACAFAIAAAAGCNCKSPTEASTVSLPAGVLRVEVNGKTTLKVGESTQLAATAFFQDGSTQDVSTASTWVSDPPAVCELNTVGEVKGTAPGSCNVSAVYTNVAGQLGLAIAGTPDGTPPSTPPTTPDTPTTPETPDAPYVVSLAIEGVSSLHVGDAVEWSAVAGLSDGTHRTVTADATWASALPSIAAINGSGLLSALSPGTTAIQAFYQGHSASAPIIVAANGSVLPTVTSLTVSGTPTVTAGQTTQLLATAHFSDGSSQDVTPIAAWTSGAQPTATVSGGLVTGVSAGSAAIAASYSGQSGQLVVTVTAAPAAKQLVGLEVNADVDLSHVALGDLVQLHVFGVYSDGSKEDVTSSAAVTADDPLLRIDGPGLLNVLVTAGSALVDPDHVLNVQYGGFTEAVHVTITPPILESLQLGTGDVLATSLNSQLPALQALFAGNQPATLGADFPGVQWDVQPRGLLGTVLNTLGVSLNQVITISNGAITPINVPLLNQVLGLVGGALPVNLKATYNGISSNTAQAVIGS
jgi:hypothetical protein